MRRLWPSIGNTGGMELYFAPMEGVTGYIYRQVHHAVFSGADEYWAPFIAPDSAGKFKAGSMREVLPENNDGIKLIPQVLANNPEAFLAVARELEAMGYREVNLNAGCPSGTVFAKHKGAGMLTDAAALDAFLDTVFSRCPIAVSVKTRLGAEKTDEFDRLLEVYGKYPFSRVIVHTRCRSGMYKSPTSPESFAPALELFGKRACYNGNITDVNKYNALVQMYPALASLMLGRGLAANPALARQLRGGGRLERNELKQFHDTLVDRTLSSGLCEVYTVGRMKELWFYMSSMFVNCEKQVKAIKKAKHIDEYNAAVNALFSSCEFDGSAAFPV